MRFLEMPLMQKIGNLFGSVQKLIIQNMTWKTCQNGVFEAIAGHVEMSKLGCKHLIILLHGNL